MLNFCLRQLSDSPHSDSHPWNLHALIRNLLHVPYSENPLKGNICACSAKLPSLTATCIATVFITFSRIAHSLWNEHFNILKFLCNSTSVKKKHHIFLLPVLAANFHSLSLLLLLSYQHTTACAFWQLPDYLHFMMVLSGTFKGERWKSPY